MTDDDFRDAISLCLETNPIDGMCSGLTMPSGNHGAMPDWDVSQVTDMSFAFGYDDFNVDISNWDVSNVTNMRSMFYDAYSFNQDISNWDVSQVTDMHNMFYVASSFNQPIGEWDVSQVTTMNHMFYLADSFNQPIGEWNVSNVTVMTSILEKAYAFNQDVSSWDISNVTNMQLMFNWSNLSTDNYDSLLISWSQQNVQPNISFGALGRYYCYGEAARQILINNHGWYIEDYGYDCSTASTPITDANFITAINTCLDTNPEDGMCSDSEYGAMPDWDVSNVTDMSYAFHLKTNFNGDLSAWDVSNVTTMFQMFGTANNFNGNISSWDVSNVTIMMYLFSDATSFNQPLEDWDVSNVTEMRDMFRYSSFNQDISGWCVTNIDSEPSDFSIGSPLTESNKPVWGTCPTAGIDDQNQLDISIYPNPTSDLVYIEGNYTQLKVVVYDILGKQVMNKAITNSIDISHLEKGVYMLQLSDGVKLTTQRILKN